MLPRENGRLGAGVEFAIFGNNTHPDTVVKIPHYPYLSDTRTTTGRRFKARMNHDLNLLETFIGREYLPQTKVKSGLSGAWGISQEYINGCWLSSSHPATEHVLDQLCEIASRARVMVDQTGYGLDWFGVETWVKVPQLLLTAYWGLPSLAITNAEGEPRLKVVDSGLLYTGTKLSNQLHLPHERFSWMVTTVGLQVVGQKTGISFV